MAPSVSHTNRKTIAISVLLASSSTMVAEFIAIEPSTTSGHAKVWPVLAPTTMHQCCLPGPYHPPERTSSTTCAGVGQHGSVRQSTAAKKEGGSLVRGTEESDRIAALASAETQVRARAVLPGSSSPEHQATGALPQSADNTGSAGHHLVEPRQENRRRYARR